MKNLRKKSLFSLLLALVLMLCLLPSALGDDFAVEEVEVPQPREYLLPIDFTPGSLPKKEGYSESKDANGKKVLSYKDSTIQVEISETTWMKNRVFVADIVVSDPSQLRTASMQDADFSNKNHQGTVTTMSDNKHMRAVVAMNGDSWGAKEKNDYGVVFRQGNLIHAKLDKSGKRRMDLLLIDENGDFHGIHSAQDGDLDDPYRYEGIKILNIFSFGPILVENGEAVADFQGADTDRGNGGTWMYMRSEKDSTRMVLCQAGPLHYKIITSVGKYNHNPGLTLHQIAEFAASQGVQFAYNMDGGDSTVLYFNGKQVNPKTGQPRDVWDIIYFASAEK